MECLVSCTDHVRARLLMLALSRVSAALTLDAIAPVLAGVLLRQRLVQLLPAATGCQTTPLLSCRLPAFLELWLKGGRMGEAIISSSCLDAD